uniref:Uncharacterized protein n=1 Tax=Clandestinovirus TaxID=2831644 RepID=A0A8F8PMK2_9VIRU|nr:hypothetical protein KOM_12_336 [Clandestinovirus]
MEVDRRIPINNPRKRKLSHLNLSSVEYDAKKHKQYHVQTDDHAVFHHQQCDCCQDSEMSSLNQLQLCRTCSQAVQNKNVTTMARIFDKLVYSSSDETKAMFLEQVLKSLNLEFDQNNTQLSHISTCRDDDMNCDYIS